MTDSEKENILDLIFGKEEEGEEFDLIKWIDKQSDRDEIYQLVSQSMGLFVRSPSIDGKEP